MSCWHAAKVEALLPETGGSPLFYSSRSSFRSCDRPRYDGGMTFLHAHFSRVTEDQMTGDPSVTYCGRTRKIRGAHARSLLTCQPCREGLLRDFNSIVVRHNELIDEHNELIGEDEDLRMRLAGIQAMSSPGGASDLDVKTGVRHFHNDVVDRPGVLPWIAVKTTPLEPVPTTGLPYFDWQPASAGPSEFSSQTDD